MTWPPARTPTSSSLTPRRAGRVARPLAESRHTTPPTTVGDDGPGARTVAQGPARRRRRDAGVNRPPPPGPRRRHDLRGLRRGLPARRGVHDRRVRLQHGPQRLPGGDHRPQLRGPDHRLHLSAHRQLRRDAARRRGGAAVVQGIVVRELRELPSNWRSVGPSRAS